MRRSGFLFSQLLAFIWSFLPLGVDRFLAKALAILWIDILRIRRDVIYSNLNIAFPGMPEARKKEIARRSMRALCRSFFDVIRIPYLTDEWIDKHVIFEGKRELGPDGFFFLSLHLGSGDIAGAIVSRKIKPITLITKRFTNEWMDAFWFGLREKSESLFINAHAKNNAFEILAALKKKRAVAFVLDQFMGKPYGVESRFFGVTTGTAYGLALFVKKTQLPVYPLYPWWGDDGKLHIRIDEAIDLKQELSETNEVITDKFNRVLEEIITRHPEHWMWIHKRWKTYE